MRSLRGEFVKLLLVLSVPACVLACFPYSAIGFRSARHSHESRTTVAFVTLSEDEEQLAIKAVQSTLRGTGRRNPRVDLALGALPEEHTAVEVLEYSDARQKPTTAIPKLALSPFLPSMAAATPTAIAAEAPEKARPAFTRNELLKLD